MADADSTSVVRAHSTNQDLNPLLEYAFDESLDVSQTLFNIGQLGEFLAHYYAMDNPTDSEPTGGLYLIHQFMNVAIHEVREQFERQRESRRGA